MQASPCFCPNAKTGVFPRRTNQNRYPRHAEEVIRLPHVHTVREQLGAGCVRPSYSLLPLMDGRIVLLDAGYGGLQEVAEPTPPRCSRDTRSRLLGEVRSLDLGAIHGWHEAAAAARLVGRVPR